MEKIKCECGHVNPVGTELCECCGNPFYDQTTLNMRYEGAARRSQVYQRTVVDHLWNFFSSVKIAIWMIVITLLASMLGTIFPQQINIPSNVDPIDFYTDKYGYLGYVYVLLGLQDMYRSWWFVSLIVLIGISLVVCSIDRLIPLYRALTHQKVTKHINFLSRQRFHGKTKIPEPNLRATWEEARQALVAKKYQVREESDAIMGEKGRFSRLGPYINHVGLIIFLMGTLIRILPGFSLDTFVWIRDGQTVPVPETENRYYVKNEGFSLTPYQEKDLPEGAEGRASSVAKEFKTKAVLYENVNRSVSGEVELQEVSRHAILVNDPLEYKGLKLFQSDFKNEFKEFVFSLHSKETGKEFGSLMINLRYPKPMYELQDGYKVELLEYYPDFELDKRQKPVTKSDIPNNPAFIFNIISPEVPRGEKSWIFLGKTIESPGSKHKYELKLVDVTRQNVTGLIVRKDLSLPVLLLGGMISMIGLVMGFYWQHRRIWIQRVGQELWIAGHTNKNWFGLQKEVEYLIKRASLHIDIETLDQEVTSS